MQGRRVGEHGAAGHAQRGHRRVDAAQAGKPVGVHRAVAALGDGQQVGVVAGWQRPDEPDPGFLDPLVVVSRVLPGVVDQGDRGGVGVRGLVAGEQFGDQGGELGDVGSVAGVGV